MVPFACGFKDTCGLWAQVSKVNNPIEQYYGLLFSVLREDVSFACQGGYSRLSGPLNQNKSGLWSSLLINIEELFTTSNFFVLIVKLKPATG